MSGRITRIELEQRVLKVGEMLIDGESRYAIIQYALKTWGVKASQVDKYIAKAYEKWQESFEKEHKHIITWHLIARKKLYKQCLDNDDRRTALAVLHDIADLQGLYKKIIANDTDENGVAKNFGVDLDFTDEGFRKSIIKVLNGSTNGGHQEKVD